MTELQPTEIEFTGKKKRSAFWSKKAFVFYSLLLLLIILVSALTLILANRATISPEMLDPAPLPTEATELPGD